MKKIVLLSAGIVAITMGVVIGSSNADQSNGTIYACSTPRNGNVIRVSYTPVSCSAGTTPIQWGTGVAGPQGVKGETGSIGPQGQKGEKGDPGYSYDQALASANMQGSDVWSLQSGYSNSGGVGCIGNSVATISYGYGTYSCTKSLAGSSRLSILFVKSATSNGLEPDPQPFYFAADGCSSADVNHLTPAGFLMSGQNPTTYQLPSSSTCLLTWFNTRYQSSTGMYQLIASTGN